MQVNIQGVEHNLHQLVKTGVLGITSLGLWIINECENLGKRVSAPDKQKLRVTCPTGKVEFKYFSSPDVAIVSKTNAQISSISQKRRLEKQSALEINNSKCYFCLFCLVTLIQWSKSTFETRKLINSYIPWLLILSAKGPTSINTAICRWLRFIHFELQTSIHDCSLAVTLR